MIELLLVLIIVSLLATLAVPTVVRQQRKARIATAKVETRNMVIAEETVAMLFDFYVPLQWLDDGPETGLSGVDSIGNEPVGLISAGGAVLVSTLEPAITQIGRQVPFSPANRRADRLMDNWEGPFIHFQRVWAQNNDQDSTDTMRLDFPMDPWGNPYLFYTQQGVVGEGAAIMAVSDVPPLAADWDNSTTSGLLRFSNGVLTQTDNRFDRYAIVSFGPDGIRNSRLRGPDDLYGDDIIHFFGEMEPETFL